MMLFIYFLIVNSLEPRFYTGRDFSNDVKILRDKDSKNAVFKFNLPNIKFSLYYGDTVENINFSSALYEGIGASTPGQVVLTAVPKTRAYFQLYTSEGKALLSDHHLPVGNNFRDMGGIRTKNGRYIKYGKAIVSDELTGFSDDDKNYLNSMSIKTVVDFRTTSEIEGHLDANVSEVYLHYPIETGNIQALIGTTNPIQAVMRTNMENIYKKLMTDAEAIGVYKKFFEELQKPNSTPLIWHCTAGKDRAGVAAILFLSSLGVNRERILEDYQESTENVKPIYAGYNIEGLKPLFEATEQYFQALFDAIEENHGSVEEFLTEKLNVNLNEMKRLFLE